jgi:hypothetical protein
MKPSSIMLAAALAFSANTPTLAQTPDQSTPAPQMKQAPDPNRMVCEKVSVIGSRLATKRVCMTQAQWLETKRHDREETEKMQTQRPCDGEQPATTFC